MDDLSALGSAHDIAAAAMAAAGLDILMEGAEDRRDRVAEPTERMTVVKEEDDVHDVKQETQSTSEGMRKDHIEKTSKRSYDSMLEQSSSEQREGKMASMGAKGLSHAKRPLPTTDDAFRNAKSISDAKEEALQEPSPKPHFDLTAAKTVGSQTGQPLSKPQLPIARKGLTSASSSTQSNSSASAALALLSGIHNLEAVAQAAMGLDANGNPLPGNEESHRALAEAVKRLSASQGTGGDRSAGFPMIRTSEGVGSANEDPTLKRFQCHLCDRAFARAYNLNTHLATHDPDPAKSKPFSCPYPSCKADGGRSFSRKHDLQRHVASTHDNEPAPEDEEEIDENGTRISIVAKLGLGTPGRKFRCEECGRAFVRRDALRRHQCLPQHLPTSSASPPSEDGVVLKGYRQADLAPSSSSSVAGAGAAGAAGAGAAGAAGAGALPSIPSGLSLYTSTAPSRASAAHPAKQAKGSSSVGTTHGSGASPSFYPGGLSYESLSREVQDMAMQLVAQATTYNQSHNSTKSSKEGQMSSIVSNPHRNARTDVSGTVAATSTKGS